MKKALFLGSMLMFLVASTTSFALNYDLQPYTKCAYGSCSTSLDVSVLGLNANRINALKMVNITNFLIKSGIINDWKYLWNGNVLTITGSVKENTYWKFSAGGDSFDPWWNTTTCTWSEEKIFSNGYALNDASADGSNAFGMGGIVLPNISILQIVGVHYPSNPYTVVRIYDAAGTGILYSNSSGSNNWANFTNANITTNFSIMSMPSGTRIYYATPTYPMASSGFNLTCGISNTGPYKCANGNTLTFEYDKIVYKEYTCISNNIYYTTSLFLNGSASNYTAYNTTNLSLMAYTNMTGLNVSLYRNGTLINSTLTNTTYNSNFNAGMYNFTAYFFNASMNDTLTFWANLTLPPVPVPASTFSITYNVDLNDAPLKCANATHIYRNATIFNNGSAVPIWEIYSCPEGCDNISNQCNMPQFQENVLYFVIIVISAISVFVFLSWLLK